MPSSTIQWSKEYCEDLGKEDENGFLEYAYQYFVYKFNLPNGNKIVVRQYTDEPDKGNLFMSTASIKHAGEEFLMEENKFVSAVIAFLQSIEKITQFYYFSGDCKLLDIRMLGADSHSFLFMQALE